MKSFFAIILAIALSASAFATDYFGYSSVEGTTQIIWAAGGPTSCNGASCGLNLGSQGGWVYNSVDFPGGGWLCGASDPSTNPCVATITLPHALTLGQSYRIFSYGIDYDNGQSFKVTSGGTDSTPAQYNDRADGIRYWSPPVTLVAGANSATLTYTITRSAYSKYLFGGLYVTIDPNVVAINQGGQRTAVNLTPPTVMDDSAAVGGNLIQNSRFASPPDATWNAYANLFGTAANMWDCNAIHYSGSCALKIPLGAAGRRNGLLDAPSGINSRIFHLSPNKLYTAGCWVKLDVGTDPVWAVAIGLNNVFIPPPGYTAQYGPGQFHYLTAAEGWYLLYKTAYAVAYPSSDFYISINSNGYEGSNLYVGACFLHQGSSTTYDTPNELDSQITATKPGGIYYADDTLSATLRTDNSAGATVAGTLNYELWDITQTRVANGTVSLSVSANSTASQSFDFSGIGSKLGLFRLVTWLDNKNDSEKESWVSVVPHPSTSGVDTASYFGTHPNFTDETSTIMQRLRIKWARSLSPNGSYRWAVAEPSDGSFVWDDGSAVEAASYGMTTLANIGSFVPAYAVSGGCPILSKVTTFFSTVVNHYKTNVHYWEIMNEDTKNGSPYSASCYAAVLKTASDAIEAADPTATKICMGGLQASDITAVLASLASQFSSWNVLTHCPILSTHDYPGGEPPQNLHQFVVAGYQVWNTETGEFTNADVQGMGPNANFSSPGQTIFRFEDSSRLYSSIADHPAMLVMNAARSIAEGMKKYIYYDSRILGSPIDNEASTSNLNGDFTIRANGIAMAILASYIDKSTGQGNQKNDGDTYALAYDTGGTSPVAILASGSNTPHQIILSGVSHSDFTVKDMMGNPVTFSGATVPFGRRPVYIVGSGISIATLKTALSSGTVSSISDTIAPNVVILDAPRGPLTLAQNAFRVRWIAIDDTSLPNLGEPNQEGVSTNVPTPDALLYSYKLDGYDSWSAFSARTFVDYSGVPYGPYTLRVKAKDAAGNESAEATRAITILNPNGDVNSRQFGGFLIHP